MVKAVQVVFTFSDEWEDFDKIAVFSNGTKTLDVSIDDENKCYIPHEMLEVPGKEVTVGIYGSEGEGADYSAIPTAECSLGKVLKGVDPLGEEPSEPTPTVWDDLIARVVNLEEPAHTGWESVEAEGLLGSSYGASVDGNKIDFTLSGGYVNLSHTGRVNFRLSVPADYKGLIGASVDGVQLTPNSRGAFEYNGEVGGDIRIESLGLDPVSCSFATLQVFKETGGILSDADYKDFLAMKEAIGNIGATFDEVHEYAESLIGGEGA
jgi:hypothetical protein